jgi:hypothetical protein
MWQGLDARKIFLAFRRGEVFLHLTSPFIGLSPSYDGGGRLTKTGHFNLLRTPGVSSRALRFREEANPKTELPVGFVPRFPETVR